MSATKVTIQVIGTRAYISADDLYRYLTDEAEGVERRVVGADDDMAKRWTIVGKSIRVVRDNIARMTDEARTAAS